MCFRYSPTFIASQEAQLVRLDESLNAMAKLNLALLPRTVADFTTFCTNANSCTERTNHLIADRDRNILWVARVLASSIHSSLALFHQYLARRFLALASLILFLSILLPSADTS